MAVLYNKRKFIFRLIILLPIFLITVNDSWAEEAIKYDPYPIVFVHGYNIERTSTYDDLWRTTIKEFGKYFYDNQGNAKYFSDWEYCQKLDYIVKSEGDINSIAGDLKNYIDLIVNVLLSGREDADKKVTIVAHSSGGLVTRRFLAKYPTYQDKIERVVFIGTPHLGSPVASGIILIDRLRPELENALRDDFRGIPTDRGGEPDWQYQAYLYRWNMINDTLVWFDFIYNTLDIDPISVNRMLAGYNNTPYKPYLPHNQGQRVTIGQLVVPGTVTASMAFIGEAYDSASHLRAQTAPLIKTSSYGQDVDNVTFIDANSFAIPNKFRLIEGTGSSWAVYMGKSLGSLLKGAGDYPIEYSGLPTGNTLEDLDAGDGIVTCSSQTGILNQIPEGSQVDSGDTIYQIPNTHITESSAWQTILQAIDDKPVIDNVRIIRLYDTYGYLKSTYLVVKVNDYLLADVEFKLDGIIAQNLNEYLDPVTGTYKPYIKGRENKDFLKERDVVIGDEADNTLTSLHLLPGEFYLKISDYGSIKIKNPAGKETECRILYPAGAFAKFKYFVTTMPLDRSQYPPYLWTTILGEWALSYNEFRAYAYNSFLSSPLWFSTDDNMHIPGDTPGRGISACVHGYGWWDASGYNGYVSSAHRTLIAYMEDHNFLNFPVDTSGKTIRVAKFSGYLCKELNGGGADFKMNIYRDSTNTWPVTQNSSGDISLFSIDTSLYQDRSYFETTIDMANINPNGYNVWETRSGLIEFALHNNLFPESIPNDLSFTYLGPGMQAHFKRSAYINAPVLIIIYE